MNHQAPSRTTGGWPGLGVLTWACMALLIPSVAAANWKTSLLRTVQQTTLDSTSQVGFLRSDSYAVRGTAVSADGPLLEQGSWNTGVQFSPTVAGGVFSLVITMQQADPPPLASFDAVTAPGRQQSTSIAPNLLDGTMNLEGRLRAESGSAASKVQLNTSHTMSVF